MTREELKELYSMLVADELGGNRGREYYDDICQSCGSDERTGHTLQCRFAAMLVLLAEAGGIGAEAEKLRQFKTGIRVCRVCDRRDPDLDKYACTSTLEHNIGLEHV